MSGYARSPWYENQYEDRHGRVAVAEPPGDEEWAPYSAAEAALEPPSKGRRVTRVVVIVSAVAALLLVGVVAFAATVLLGGGPASKKSSNSTGVPTNTGPANNLSPAAPPSENAVADPTPSPS